MLVNCDSCQKKFEVPNSAITDAGRLLQCGSCGNKWTQYPIKEKKLENIKRVTPPKIKKPIDINKTKTSTKKKKKKREINLYSEEYLKKKHGLEIKDPKIDKNSKKQNLRTGFDFYKYLIIVSIFFITVIGILNLTRDIIITNFPFAESYINYLYEILDIIKITVTNLID